MVLQIKHHPFTVDEYYRMAAAGILSEEDRVELIHGEIIEMSPVGPRHAARVSRLNQLFSNILGEKVLIRIQDPIHLSSNSEPQPDLALVQPRPDYYAEAHPEPDDVFLMVEISDTSLDYDLEVKIPLYARAGIPEVWVWDVEHNHFIIHHTPNRGRYQVVKKVQSGETLHVTTFPEIEVRLP